MIKLRPEQLEALAVVAMQQAIDRLMARLRVSCPSQTREMDDATLRREVEAGIAQAARYGLATENRVAVFLECRLDLGPDFDTREAWASDALNNTGLFPHEKAEALSDRDMLGGGGES